MRARRYIHIPTRVLRYKLRRRYARFYATVKPAYCDLFAVRARTVPEMAEKEKKENGIEVYEGKSNDLIPFTDILAAR